MESLQIIGDEHQSLAAILHAIRFMLKEVAAERLAADRQLFQAMVHYLLGQIDQRCDFARARPHDAANPLPVSRE